jgi:hypothetical protein
MSILVDFCQSGFDIGKGMGIARYPAVKPVGELTTDLFQYQPNRRIRDP